METLLWLVRLPEEEDGPKSDHPAMRQYGGEIVPHHQQWEDLLPPVRAAVFSRLLCYKQLEWREVLWPFLLDPQGPPRLELFVRRSPKGKLSWT